MLRFKIWAFFGFILRCCGWMTLGCVFAEMSEISAVSASLWLFAGLCLVVGYEMK